DLGDFAAPLSDVHHHGAAACVQDLEAVGGEEPWTFGALDTHWIVRAAHEHRRWLGHSGILTVIRCRGQRTNLAAALDGALLDGAGLAPAVELVLAVTKRAQDFVGMLPELRRERPYRSRRVRELQRHAHLLDLLAAGALDLDDHIAREHLRIARHLVEREHPAGADVALAENREPLIARFGFEFFSEHAC